MPFQFGAGLLRDVECFSLCICALPSWTSSCTSFSVHFVGARSRKTFPVPVRDVFAWLWCTLYCIIFFFRLQKWVGVSFIQLALDPTLTIQRCVDEYKSLSVCATKKCACMTWTEYGYKVGYVMSAISLCKEFFFIIARALNGLLSWKPLSVSSCSSKMAP